MALSAAMTHSRSNRSPRYISCGQALVELALVLPLFALILSGLVFFARLGTHRLIIHQAVHQALIESSERDESMDAARRRLRELLQAVVQQRSSIEMVRQELWDVPWGPRRAEVEWRVQAPRWLPSKGWFHQKVSGDCFSGTRIGGGPG